MRLIESPIFTALIGRAISDEAYRALQLELALRPELGSIIPSSGGLRKMRWAAKGRGKRGGLRVVYYWDAPSGTCYMLFVYAKNRQSDLTPQQVKSLARLVEQEFP